MKAIIYAAFCGTGKSYICKRHKGSSDVECWEYRNSKFPDNYINEIKEIHSMGHMVFISADPIVLNKLNDLKYNITLIYPDLSLRSEYLDRFISRNSASDFIGMVMINWEKWLKGLAQLDYCNHIVLQSGQYLSDVIINY